MQKIQHCLHQLDRKLFCKYLTIFSASSITISIFHQLLQLNLEEEVNSDKSTAKRSQVTGHLVITMPKVCQV